MRRWLTIFVCLQGLGLLLAVVPSPSRGVTRSFTLYGSFSGGWGATSTSIASPGPPLSVTVGDVVTMTLYSQDSAPHTFNIDYDGGGAFGSTTGEPLSTQFLSPTIPTTYTFTASSTGTFSYWCTIHGGAMTGAWTTQAAPPSNTPPTVSFTSPGGAAAWTGGSTHTITWTMSDAQDSSSALRVWLNVTIGGVQSKLVENQTGTTAFTWSVPHVNATATLHLDVLDTGGLGSFAARIFSIDGSRPQVKGWGSGEVPYVFFADFNETMTPSTSTQDVALRDLNTSSWLAGTITWRSGVTEVAFAPVGGAVPGHTYRLLVNSTLKDASDPGNYLASPFAVNITVPASPPPPPIPWYFSPLLLIPIPIVAIVAVVLFVLLRRNRKT